MLTGLDYALPQGPFVADFEGQYGYFANQSQTFTDTGSLLRGMATLRSAARTRRKALVISSLDENGLRSQVVRFPHVPNRTSAAA
jgi:hypothetical protein